MSLTSSPSVIMRLISLATLLLLCSLEVPWAGRRPIGGKGKRKVEHLNNYDYPQATERPVVGVLTLPMEASFKRLNGTSYIA